MTISEASTPERIWAAPTYVPWAATTTTTSTTRARWAAEQHFVYEVSNDADVILLSMSTGERLVTVVVLPDESSPTGQSVSICRTADEQRDFYRANRSRRHIVSADVFTSIGSDWYGLVEGVLLHRILATGELAYTRMVGLLPVSGSEDAIVGELGFGVPVVDRPAADVIDARRHVLHVERARHDALLARDPERLAALYAPNATVVERDHPEREQVVLTGRDEIADFYARRFSTWPDARVEPVVTLAEDWFGFEELLWEGYRNGRLEQFRTAAVIETTGPGKSGESGLILHQIGYGTEVQPFDPEHS